MLVAQFLQFVFEGGDISFERLGGASKVGHGTHDAGGLDGSSHCSLVPVAEEAAVAALDVAVDSEKLSQHLDVAPVDVVLFYLPQVLLPLLVAVQRLEVMPQRLVGLQLIISSLHTELAGAIVGGGIELALPEVFELVQQVCSALGVDEVG